MWLPTVTFDVTAAYVLGINCASYGGLLSGFREWLIVKCDWRNNLAWTELVLRIAFPDTDDPRALLKSEDHDRHARETLFELLDAFFAETRKRDGLRFIFLRYQSWLRRQEWYTPTGPDWFEDAPGGR
jgi:hypothetical protein